MSLDEMLDHYGSGYESSRLGAGPGLVELDRTKAIVTRYLPESPAIIYDIGGGPGAYASWLLGLGHTVHLVDPLAIHVEQAHRAMSDTATAGWSAAVGDARNLDLPDCSADLVLLLGPLYHLIERDDRITALREAHRVLRPGGVVFAAAISRFASLLDGMARNFLDDPEFLPIVERDLAEGQHRNPRGHPSYFTTAFFHRPDQLRDEVQEAGFDLDKVCGLEGPAWILPDIQQRWGDTDRRAVWMRMLERAECEAELLGVSAHLLAVARR